MNMAKQAAFLLLLIAVVSACRESDDIRHNLSSEVMKDASAPGAVTVRTDPAGIEKGKDLFGQKCAFCHDAYSSENRTGPGLYGILKKDRLPVSGKPATPENIIMQLKNPYRIMPAFPDLSDEDILNVIAFLNTL